MYTMKRKIILPRKDHEVYFLPMPPRMNRKKLSQLVNNKLFELHPGFSASTAFDIHKICIDKKYWLIITVMEQELLTEYRIMNPKTLFFTNTALVLRLPDIAEQPLYQLGEETIGYQKEIEEPVSIPADENSAADNPGFDMVIKKRLSFAPYWWSVFRKKTPVVVILSCFIVLLTGIWGFTLSFTSKEGTPLAAAEEIENEGSTAVNIETIYVPDFFSTLTDFSRIIYKLDGTVLQWQYDIFALPPIKADLRGIDTIKIFESIKTLGYLLTDNISPILYEDGKPRYTLNLLFNREAYNIQNFSTYKSQEQCAEVLLYIHSILSVYGIEIVSETLPSSNTEISPISINIKSKAGIFPAAMEKITGALWNNSMMIVSSRITFDGGNGVFHCSVDLLPVEDKYVYAASLKEYQEIIPLVFGYKPSSPAVRQAANAQSVIEDDFSEYTKVGSIINDDGIEIIYYRTMEGKILTSERR